MKSPFVGGEIFISVHILIYQVLDSYECSTVKGYIFEFVRLQAICKSKMAAFKYFSKQINIKRTGQWYRIPNHAYRGL